MEEILKHSPLLAGLDDQTVAEIAQFSRKLQFHDGQIIIREGDRNESDIFLLLSGEAEVVFRAPGYHYQPRESGISCGGLSLFGEISCVLGEPRTATVRCLGNGEMIRIQGAALRDYMEDHPHQGYVILRNILHFMARRLTHANALLKNGLL